MANQSIDKEINFLRRAGTGKVFSVQKINRPMLLVLALRYVYLRRYQSYHYSHPQRHIWIYLRCNGAVYSGWDTKERGGAVS